MKFNKKSKPDAGNWIFDKSKNKWEEDDSLAEKMKPLYTLRRECKSSTIVFHVDSFPRQGNTTLRSVLLRCFEDIAIPDPMIHVTSFTLKAINDGQVIISTVRDPHDTLCSYISRAILSGQFKEKYTDNKVKKEEILKCIKYYNRYLNFLIQNHQSIYLIHFDEIVKMHTDYNHFKELENKILTFFSKKYNLKFTKNDKPRYNDIKYSSTVDRNIKSQLITNKYYVKKIKKSYKLYSKILKLIEQNEKLFSN